MGNTAKVLLSILALFLVVCGVGGFFAARKVKTMGGQFIDQAQQEATAARQWALGHQQSDCMDEGMRRALACRDNTCQFGASMFSSACLSAATPTPGLCDDVPPQQQFSASLQWQNQRCGAMPPADAQRCRNITTTLQQHCAMRSIRTDAGVAR